MKTLLVATTNLGKLEEFREWFARYPVRFVSLAEVGLAGMDVEETGITFTDNALLKANAYQRASGLATLADDSGIIVDALNGAPGVYSARYAPTVAERNAKLLNALQGIPPEQRTARFVCVIALVTGDGLTVSAEGTIEGRVANAARGDYGHGYDPVFLLPDGRTMAELSAEEKNRTSHRGRALARLDPVLQALYGGA